MPEGNTRAAGDLIKQLLRTECSPRPQDPVACQRADMTCFQLLFNVQFRCARKEPLDRLPVKEGFGKLKDPCLPNVVLELLEGQAAEGDRCLGRDICSTGVQLCVCCAGTAVVLRNLLEWLGRAADGHAVQAYHPEQERFGKLLSSTRASRAAARV